MAVRSSARSIRASRTTGYWGARRLISASIGSRYRDHRADQLAGQLGRAPGRFSDSARWRSRTASAVRWPKSASKTAESASRRPVRRRPDPVSPRRRRPARSRHAGRARAAAPRSPRPPTRTSPVERPEWPGRARATIQIRTVTRVLEDADADRAAAEQPSPRRRRRGRPGRRPAPPAPPARPARGSTDGPTVSSWPLTRRPLGGSARLAPAACRRRSRRSPAGRVASARRLADERREPLVRAVVAADVAREADHPRCAPGRG